MFNTIEISTTGPIGRIWLNRPDRLNALSIELLRELSAAARHFDTLPDTRAVIVAGRGRAFSAGADLQGFPQLDEPAIRAAADADGLIAGLLDPECQKAREDYIKSRL